MERREKRSTQLEFCKLVNVCNVFRTAIIIIVIIISLTIFCISYSRKRKQCAKRNEQRRRQEVESHGGGPVDGMAPLPQTPIPNSDPARRPDSATI